MDTNAIDQAKARLRKAEKSLELLKAAEAYDEAEEAWSDFLLATSTIYSKLEQGSKSKGTSAGWFGRKKKERKDDPLLHYLHQARNSDEHGIERVAERGGNQIDITDSHEPLRFNERRRKTFNIYDGQTRKLKFENVEGIVAGPCLQMIRVHDRRFGNFCDPPESHLGNPISDQDRHLVSIAEMGLRYLIALINEAEQLI